MRRGAIRGAGYSFFVVVREDDGQFRADAVLMDAAGKSQNMWLYAPTPREALSAICSEVDNAVGVLNGRR